MKILLIILTLFLTNCKLNKIVNHHGIHNLELKSTELIVNQTNINDIKRILGPPSSKSYFDNDIIIYLERKTSNSKLLKLGKRKLLTKFVNLLCSLSASFENLRFALYFLSISSFVNGCFLPPLKQF